MAEIVLYLDEPLFLPYDYSEFTTVLSVILNMH